MASDPWFIKHKPKRFTDLLFANDVHLKSLDWLKTYTAGSILHITGPTGSGKTCLVYLIAKVYKYTVVEITKDN